jgi:hypothetical protein
MLDAWCCHARFLCATVPVRDSHTLLWDPGQCSCAQTFLGASLSAFCTMLLTAQASRKGVAEQLVENKQEALVFDTKDKDRSH